MDLSQIKLVVSDMDGTLLNSKSEINPDFFGLYAQLKQHKIHFAAASGRQYHSICEKLKPIKNEISIIAENGGFTVSGDFELDGAQLNSFLVKKILKRLRQLADTEVVLCGKERAYIESRNDYFLGFFKDFYPAHQWLEDLDEVDSSICKIACYHQHDTAEKLEIALNNLTDDLHIKISGKHWFDLAHQDSHKGNAVQNLQNHLNIRPEETLVFGDYDNDLEMMQNAGLSVAMENAHHSVKRIASHHTVSNDNLGVEKVLTELLHQRRTEH